VMKADLDYLLAMKGSLGREGLAQAYCLYGQYWLALNKAPKAVEMFRKASAMSDTRFGKEAKKSLDRLEG
jgi:hypothetical protein